MEKFGRIGLSPISITILFTIVIFNFIDNFKFFLDIFITITAIIIINLFLFYFPYFKFLLILASTT